jgi:hypothetical protein
MPDRYDDAKRSLEGVPAPDLWAEAARRAETEPALPLVAAATRPGHTRRWLAAAAVGLLAIGTAAVVVNQDDTVDVGPGDPSRVTDDTEDVTVYQANGACQLGITGDPPPEPAAVAPAETFVAGTVGTLVSGDLNATQTFEVQVPGQVVTDLVGERVEDIELERGTAQAWFRERAAVDGSLESVVQVRWFTGRQEACESFTVTVAGGTEDENRHAAVDLAERVLVSSEVGEAEPPAPAPGPNPLAGTEWQLERSTVDGEPTLRPTG